MSRPVTLPLLRSAARLVPLAVLLGLGTPACRSGPLFEPDPFHVELIRQLEDETGFLSERDPPEMVCLVPSRPICYCRPDERHLALGGLSPQDRLDLNRVSSEELMELPGIGPALAGEIIAFRKSHPFATVEDLLEVDGIGAGRLRRISPLVRVGPP